MTVQRYEHMKRAIKTRAIIERHYRAPLRYEMGALQRPRPGPPQRHYERPPEGSALEQASATLYHDPHQQLATQPHTAQKRPVHRVYTHTSTSKQPQCTVAPRAASARLCTYCIHALPVRKSKFEFFIYLEFLS